MAVQGAAQVPAEQQAIFDEQRRLNSENLASSMQMMRVQQEQATTGSHFNAQQYD